MGAVKKKNHSDNDLKSEVLELSFFKDFSEEHISELLPYFSTFLLKKGETLLNEGERNTNVFILLSGFLDVNLKGENITKLSRRGDIIGEMSFLNNLPTSATIIANKPSELLCFKINEAKNLSKSCKENLYSALYRVLAEVLAIKLSETNEKARKFEVTNRELVVAQAKLTQQNEDLEKAIDERTRDLEQKNIELQNSHEKLEQTNFELKTSFIQLEELYKRFDLGLSKINEFHKERLHVFSDQLISLIDSIEDKKSKECISNLKYELEKLEKALVPLDRLYQSETAMKSTRVLVGDANPKQKVITKLALGGTGVDLELCDSIEDGKNKLEKSDYDIVIFDSEYLPLIEIAKNKNTEVECVFVTSGNISDQILDIKKFPYLRNIVSRNDNNRAFTVKSIFSTVKKLADDDIMGLEKYLSWGVEIQEDRVKSSDQRPELIERASNYFKEMGLRNTVLSRCELVLEETLMNAIYDAPVDRDGNSLYNSVSRKEIIKLKSHEQGKVRYGCDGVYAAISVSDPFGSLSLNTVLTYLDYCYSSKGENPNENNDKKAGAGRGLHQIFENSDMVVFNVSKNSRTEIICLFNTDLKQSKEQAYPSFHLFFKD